MVYFADGRTAEHLGREGIRDFADLMSDAFMGHENWSHVLQNPRRRKQVLYHLFAFMGAVFDRYGHVVVAVGEDGRSIGYITFMENRDHAQMSFGRILRTGALGHGLAFLACLGPRELAGMRAFNRAVKSFYSGYDADPSGLHLYNTGIDPDFKGRGIMKRVFAYADARLAEAGFTSYFLETTDPANIPVYKRFGLLEFATLPIAGSERALHYFHKSIP
jgi:GNAT superfamily N-acetyltransferase